MNERIFKVPHSFLQRHTGTGYCAGSSTGLAVLLQGHFAGKPLHQCPTCFWVTNRYLPRFTWGVMVITEILHLCCPNSMNSLSFPTVADDLSAARSAGGPTTASPETHAWLLSATLRLADQNKPMLLKLLIETAIFLAFLTRLATRLMTRASRPSAAPVGACAARAPARVGSAHQRLHAAFSVVVVMLHQVRWGARGGASNSQLRTCRVAHVTKRESSPRGRVQATMGVGKGACPASRRRCCRPAAQWQAWRRNCIHLVSSAPFSFPTSEGA